MDAPPPPTAKHALSHEGPLGSQSSSLRLKPQAPLYKGPGGSSAGPGPRLTAAHQPREPQPLRPRETPVPTHSPRAHAHVQGSPARPTGPSPGKQSLPYVLPLSRAAPDHPDVSLHFRYLPESAGTECSHQADKKSGKGGVTPGVIMFGSCATRPHVRSDVITPRPPKRPGLRPDETRDPPGLAPPGAHSSERRVCGRLRGAWDV